MIRFLLKELMKQRLGALMLLLVMLLTATTAWADTEVKYIDADGNEQSCTEFTNLTGNETSLSAGWYVVNSNITYTSTVNLTGNVTLILEDGCTMNVGTSESRIDGIGIARQNNGNQSLTIFGQTEGTGALNIYTGNNAIIAYAVTINGGNVTVSADGQWSTGINAKGTNLTINGGMVNATATGDYTMALTAEGNITINGGTVNANGETYGIASNHGTITLGWNKPTDRISITANSYYGTVKVADGKKLYNGVDKVLSGTITDISDINGKTLVPAYKVNFTDVEHGTVVADKSFVTADAEDKTVTLTITPDTYYCIESLTVTDASSNTVTVNNNTFTMPASDVTVSATFTKIIASVIVGENETYYGSFSAAETAAKAAYVAAQGETAAVVPTLKLYDDVAYGANSLQLGNGTDAFEMTFDLNGHTITGDLTVESGSKLMLIDSSNGNGHINGAISVPVDALQNCLTNWSDKADVIKSTGKIKTDIINNLTWTLTKADGDKIDGNFPLKLTIEGNGTMGSFSWYGAPWYAVHSYITEASLPEGLDQIGVYAFQDCAITSITIPASVRELDYAFYNCKKLANVTFKGNIKEIGVNAFNGCSALKEITLPNSVNKLGQNAFYNSGLTRITIPGSVSKIPMSAFSDCKSLAEVTLSEGLEEIDWAFSGCTSLTEISIPSSVTSIGPNSFYGCTALKTVRINSTNISIYKTAFMNCPSLERIILPNTTTLANFVSNEELYYFYGKIFCTEGYCGVSTENEGKNVIWTMMSTEETDEKDIPLPRYALNIRVNPDVSNQTNFNIGEYNFKDTTDDPWNGMRDYISELNIGEGVTSIASNAFYSLNKIKYVIIPNSVETIAGNAFSDCSNLKWIIVNNIDKFMNADGWDNNTKTMLRSSKTTLFATGATNEWMTWCSDIAYTKPEGCTVYTVSGVNSEQVQVAEVEGDVIPAYTPVLIKRAESELTADIKAELSAIVESVSANGTSYNEIDKDTRAYQGTVIASYDGGCVYGNTGAVLNPKNNGWVVNDEYTSTYALYSDKFLMIDADKGIPTHRFIMRVSHKNDDARCTRSLMIGVGGDTTGMEELKNEKIEELNSEWYDLQGRRLDSKPTKKGLYINNGKKIVIK